MEAHFDTLVPATGEREPQGIEFNQDGTRMFLIGTTGNEVNQYTLSEGFNIACLLYTSPSPRDVEESRMPASA